MLDELAKMMTHKANEHQLLQKRERKILQKIKFHKIKKVNKNIIKGEAFRILKWTINF